MSTRYLGSNRADFLAEEGFLDEAETVDIKRVLTYQVAQAMKDRKLSKAAMALQMNTNRTTEDTSG